MVGRINTFVESKKIRVRVFLQLLPILIPMLVIVAVNYSSSRSASLESSEELGKLIVSNASDEMNSFLQRQAAKFGEWTREDIYGLAIEFDTTRELGSHLQEQIEAAPEFQLLAIVDADGKVLQANGREGSLDGLIGEVAEEAQAADGSDGGTIRIISGGLHRSAGASDGLAFLFSRPCSDSSGGRAGSFLAFLDWGSLAKRIDGVRGALRDAGFPGAEAALIDSEKMTALSHSDAERKGAAFQAEPALKEALADGSDGDGFRTFDVGGNTNYVTAAKIHDAESLAGSGTAVSASRLALLGLIPQGNVLAEGRRILAVNAALTLVGFALLFGLIWIVGGRIAQPINNTALILKDIAQGEGDLTRRIEVESHDEIGDLAEWFNSFVEKLQGIIRSVGETTSSLGEEARQLTAISSKLNENAENTSRRAGDTSAVGRQVNDNVQTIANSVGGIEESIREIAQSSQNASQVAGGAVEMADSASEAISRLDDSSAEIGNVVKVITSIAEQTNLLALNATIEAARAGDAGKGFAVVANEVKELANQTGKATSDISDKVAAIQNSTQGAVETISKISGIINQINDLQTTIASAVEEQSITINEISQNITMAADGSSRISHGIDELAAEAQNTSAGAGETQSSAGTLSRSVGRLESLVGQFRF